MQTVSTRRALAAACATAAVAAVAAAPADASHFRGSNLSWSTSGQNQADFDFTASFRRGYSGTAPDGGLAIGDQFNESIGATTLSFGDGSSNPGRFEVIAVNQADDYVIARMVQPGVPDPLRHLYGGPGPWDAGFTSCCNISELNNNSDANYGDTTRIDFSKKASPKSSLAPIVEIGDAGLQQVPIPAVDPEGRALRWSLTPQSESYWDSPAGLTIDPGTGVLRWDTTGVAPGLWTTSVTVESLEAGAPVASTQVNFILRVSADANRPPAFVAPTPDAGTVYEVDPGREVVIPVKATDDDAADRVHLDHLGLPAGASLQGSDGNPAQATFRWTPTVANGGDHLVSFTAQDDHQPRTGSAIPRTVVVRVRKTRPTSLSANPAVLDAEGLKLYLNPSAVLRAAAPTEPLAGRTVRFATKGKAVCQAKTNASGLAACTGVQPLTNTVLGLTEYTATYDGESAFAGSTGKGKLVRAGTVTVP